MLSRHPLEQTSTTNYIEKHVNFTVKHASPNALTIEDIKTATNTDPVLQQLINIIQTNTWHKLDKASKTEEIQQLKRYHQMKETLTVNEEQNLVLKDRKIIIPKCYEKTMAILAHEGHQGLVKTKVLLRSKIFFLGMDELVAKRLIYCIACQAVQKNTVPPAIQSTEIPERVWQTVNMDYLGSLPDGKYALAMIDQRSRYPIVEFTTSKNAKNLINILNKTFTHFGYPENLVSDNGPPFKSNEIKKYMAKMRNKTSTSNTIMATSQRRN